MAVGFEVEIFLNEVERTRGRARWLVKPLLAKATRRSENIFDE